MTKTWCVRLSLILLLTTVLLAACGADPEPAPTSDAADQTLVRDAQAVPPAEGPTPVSDPGATSDGPGAPGRIDATGMPPASLAADTFEVRHRFRWRLEFFTYTGAEAIEPGALAADIARSVQGFWHFDARSQTWLNYSVRLPASLNTLRLIEPGDPVFVQFQLNAPGLRTLIVIPVEYAVADLAEDGAPPVLVLQPGWNTVAYLGGFGATMRELLDLHPNLQAGFRFVVDRWVGVSKDLPPGFLPPLILARLDPLLLYNAGDDALTIPWPRVAPDATLSRPFVERVTRDTNFDLLPSGRPPLLEAYLAVAGQTLDGSVRAGLPRTDVLDGLRAGFFSLQLGPEGWTATAILLLTAPASEAELTQLGFATQFSSAVGVMGRARLQG